MSETNLLSFNTMHIDAECKKIIPIYSEKGIFDVLVQGLTPLKILGGGSNILLTGNQDAYILKNEIKGIHIIDEDENEVLVNVGGGEIWHNLVMWTISHNLGGIENLALIPGCVGAAPIQNIGAYGVEQSNTFHSLKAVHLNKGTSKTFFRDDCEFGYRDSIFKNAIKGEYMITQVNYKFSKRPRVQTSYGAIEKKLEEKKIDNPTIADVANAVIEIRQSKLPDPKIIPNTGSFFKNPIISKLDFERLKHKYDDIPNYPAGNGLVKLPAAWLIEKAGYKGVRNGDAGVHKNHALVLVNYGNASGQDMLQLAKEIQVAVVKEFAIEIIPEVNIW